jgi:hypothetical protein
MQFRFECRAIHAELQILQCSKRHYKCRPAEGLPDNEKSTILKVVSAYIRDFKARQTYLVL